MSHMKKNTEENLPAQDIRFLLCDPGNSDDFSIPGMERLSGPIRCLDRAVAGNPAFIAVCFRPVRKRESENLVELCAALRRNPHTRKIPLIALLPCRHRELLESLENAGVEYVRHREQRLTDPEQMHSMMEEMGPEDSIGYHLAELCPHLRYRPMEPDQEIILCAAYLERMVLGGSRLHDICESPTHSGCEYFLKPRPAS